jgi:hypothetical protein
VYLVRLILTSLDALNNHSFNHSFDISFAQPVSAFHHMRFENLSRLRIALSLHDTKLIFWPCDLKFYLPITGQNNGVFLMHLSFLHDLTPPRMR